MIKIKMKYMVLLFLALSTTQLEVKAYNKQEIVNLVVKKEELKNNQTNLYTLKDKINISTGWIIKDNKWYYIEENGELKNGWLKYKDKWYFFSKDTGEMQIGFINDGGQVYYLDKDGAMQIGWNEIDNKYYYFENSGEMKVGWLKYNNNWYLLKKSGDMATGWEKYGLIYYYFDGSGAMKKGWQETNNKWYYLEESGAMKKGWLKNNGKWYYLKASGEMATGWESESGKDYYFNNSGEMQIGWQQINSKWYYLEQSGATKKGWLNHNGIWYYLKENGEMATGWELQGKTYYYFDENGAMKTGWQYISDEWYYLESSGAMKVGFITLDRKTYLLKDNGQMGIGWEKNDEKWYYFESSGVQQKGWIQIKDKYYYLYSDSGERATNEWKVVNGITYWFNSNGTMADQDTIIKGEMYSFDNSGKYIGVGAYQEKLHVEFLNVGDADAIYIELPNGDDVLIDGGEYKDGDQIVEFLRGRNLDEKDGIEDIDYIINTHPHSDHIGGLVEVFKNFKVNNFYYPYDIEMKKYDGFEGAESIENKGYLINCMNYCYQFYKETLEEANKQGTKINDTTPGGYIDSNNILKFVHPDKTYKQNNLDKQDNLNGFDYCLINNDSAVVYASYGDFQMILASDIEVEAEKDMLKMGLIPTEDIEILKIAHHGAITSSLYEFLERVTPEFGVMTRTQSSYNNAKNLHVMKNLNKLKIDTLEAWKSDSIKIDATNKTFNIYN